MLFSHSDSRKLRIYTTAEQLRRRSTARCSASTMSGLLPLFGEPPAFVQGAKATLGASGGVKRLCCKGVASSGGLSSCAILNHASGIASRGCNGCYATGDPYPTPPQNKWITELAEANTHASVDPNLDTPPPPPANAACTGQCPPANRPRKCCRAWQSGSSRMTCRSGNLAAPLGWDTGFPFPHMQRRGAMTHRSRSRYNCDAHFGINPLRRHSDGLNFT